MGKEKVGAKQEQRNRKRKHRPSTGNSENGREKAQRNKEKRERAKQAALALLIKDFDDVVVTDAVSGASVVHTAQFTKNLPVRGSDASLLVEEDARNNRKVRGPNRGRTIRQIRQKARDFDSSEDMTIVEAIRALKNDTSFDCVQFVITEEGIWKGWIDCSGYKVRLSYHKGNKEMPKKKKKYSHTDEITLVYEIHDIETSGSAEHYWMDVKTADIVEKDNWVSGASYQVFALPKESPYDGARTIEIDPADSTASPFGWHDTNGEDGAEYTDTRGNNCLAQEDADANQSGGDRPNGGNNLEFGFSLDLNNSPDQYRDAAIANLFYWNNILHDILYLYGFDEASGNFQENNYGRGGKSGDAVRADAQDGSGTNNANFYTPPDGAKPRMQMFIWTPANPDRDSDLDAGVIAHEYCHGLSIRLTGGPSNSGCLNNVQQGGEGWSDLCGLFFTAKASDEAITPRGIGTYVLNQNPTTGIGIRPAQYTTNMDVNPYTYGDIATLSVPHGVGFVWATAVWEVYWNLVNEHGFEQNFYDVTSTAGNIKAIQLVVDGLKLQPCGPSFLDARDAILEADRNRYDGANKCLIWEGFAKRGMGYSAETSGPNTRSVTEGFDLPCACRAGGLETFEVSCNPSFFDTDPGESIEIICKVSSCSDSDVTVELSCPNNPPGISCSFIPSQVSLPAGEIRSATLSSNINSNQPEGLYAFEVKATDTNNNMASSIINVAILDGPDAVYDDNLGAPKCSSVKSFCDSYTLLEGRAATLGPELNTPNTLDDCQDGTFGIYKDDESIERIFVHTVDGSDLVAGAKVKIEATVWAWSTGSADSADFYYTGDASSDSLDWIFIATRVPPDGGKQTLSVQYTLPAGSLQGVRVNFRWRGSVSTCSTGSYDDHDDLIFAVGQAGTSPPTTSVAPSSQPSARPSMVPTTYPSVMPSSRPSSTPSMAPTLPPAPSHSPSSVPTSLPSSSQFPSPVSQVPQWTELSYASFENGWDSWVRGGSDAARYCRGTYAASGNCAIRLRDNSKDQSAMSLNLGDLGDLLLFNVLRVTFSFYVSSMEDQEDFMLEYSSNYGSDWDIVRTWKRNAYASVDTIYIDNNRFYLDEQVTLTGPFSSTAWIRFRCDASHNKDRIFIDDVRVEGF